MFSAHARQVYPAAVIRCPGSLPSLPRCGARPGTMASCVAMSADIRRAAALSRASTLSGDLPAAARYWLVRSTTRRSAGDSPAAGTGGGAHCCGAHCVTSRLNAARALTLRRRGRRAARDRADPCAASISTPGFRARAEESSPDRLDTERLKFPVGGYTVRMALDPKKWTTKTQEAMAAAIDQAKGNANPELTPDHLLLALASQDDTI